ncbi:hypothetical protein HanIR_Chr10g0466371 [Helianthus annuus]|nr:hypothetical protein HanIR_Chr10g0466371 [Helianthus annuus]
MMTRDLLAATQDLEAGTTRDRTVSTRNHEHMHTVLDFAHCYEPNHLGRILGLVYVTFLLMNCLNYTCML